MSTEMKSVFVLCMSIIILSWADKGSASVCEREYSQITSKGSDTPSCCKVKYQENGYSISRFPCSGGCCGEEDDQHCCSSGGINSEALPYVIGFSIFGVVVVVGVTVLLVWVFRKACRGVKDYSSHKKLLREVYSAETLEELFLPAQPLVSAPGTVIHPTTNVNGPFYTRHGDQPYVVPDFAAQPPQNSPTHPSRNHDNDDYGDEEQWDRWDGFPASADGVAVTGGAPTAGRGRNNPHFQEGQGEGGDRPYYYENYDRYSQPPPGYDEVVN